MKSKQPVPGPSPFLPRQRRRKKEGTERETRSFVGCIALAAQKGLLLFVKIFASDSRPSSSLQQSAGLCCCCSSGHVLPYTTTLLRVCTARATLRSTSMRRGRTNGAPPFFVKTRSPFRIKGGNKRRSAAARPVRSFVLLLFWQQPRGRDGGWRALAALLERHPLLLSRRRRRRFSFYKEPLWLTTTALSLLQQQQQANLDPLCAFSPHLLLRFPSCAILSQQQQRQPPTKCISGSLSLSLLT